MTWARALVLGFLSGCCAGGSATTTTEAENDPLPIAEPRQATLDDDLVPAKDAAPLPPDEHIELHPIALTHAEQTMQLAQVGDALVLTAGHARFELRGDDLVPAPAPDADTPAPFHGQLPADFDAIATTTTPGGDELALSHEGIATREAGGAHFVMDVLPPDVGRGFSLAGTRRGDLWVAGNHGVGHFDGKSWTTDVAPFETGEEVEGSIDAAGDLWCVEFMMGFSRLFHRAASGAWSVVPMPSAIQKTKDDGATRWFADAVASRGRGDVWVVAAYRHEAASGGVGSPSVLLHSRGGRPMIVVPK